MDNGSLAFVAFGGPIVFGVLVMGVVVAGIVLVVAALYALNLGVTRLVGRSIDAVRARHSSRPVIASEDASPGRRRD